MKKIVIILLILFASINANAKTLDKIWWVDCNNGGYWFYPGPYYHQYPPLIQYWKIFSTKQEAVNWALSQGHGYAYLEFGDGCGTLGYNHYAINTPDGVQHRYYGVWPTETYSPPVAKELNLGSPDEIPATCPLRKADPINIGSGNSYQTETDISINVPQQKMQFSRSYNSQSDRESIFGYGWTHDYNLSLEQLNQDYVNIIREDGGFSSFSRDHGESRYINHFKQGSYVDEIKDNDTVIGWSWHKSNGNLFEFNIDGRLVKITRANQEIQLTYDGSNRLQDVVDPLSGRSFTIVYTPQNRVDYLVGPVTLAIPDGKWVSYLYDTTGNLTDVIYADGSGFKYGYEDPNDVHNMTSKKDRQNHLISSWSYDTSDRAIVNTTRDGKGATINYLGNNQVEVIDQYGKATVNTYVIKDGLPLITQVNGGAGCADCSISGPVRYEYDDNIRVTEKEYINGRIKKYEDFDSQGNPGKLIDAFGTPDQKIVYYTYHPETSDRITMQSESLLASGNAETIWDYDDDGNDIPNENPTRLVYRLILKGYTKDATGAVIPFEHITLYDYNGHGQLVSIDGPKTGDLDKTVLSYDPVTFNLNTVTLPGAGTTVYSNYDAAGRPGRIIDANYNSFIYTYDGRGRVHTIRNEQDESVTTFQYNTAGEIEFVTQANGIITRFEYDNEHGRLVKMLVAVNNYIFYD
jgi:YD repeat-containing protein